MTYYQVLQIDKKASDEVIKAAYRALCHKWHPDHNPNNNQQCVVKMQQINIAYSILSDAARKAVYDQTLVITPTKTYTPPKQSHTTPRPTPKPEPTPRSTPNPEPTPKPEYEKHGEYGYGFQKDKPVPKPTFNAFLRSIPVSINNYIKSIPERIINYVIRIPGGMLDFLKELGKMCWMIIKLIAIISFYAVFGIVIALFSGGGGGSHYYYEDRYNRRH
jgi:curved DNA-binding protein CbpA